MPIPKIGRKMRIYPKILTLFSIRFWFSGFKERKKIVAWLSIKTTSLFFNQHKGNILKSDFFFSEDLKIQFWKE